jgi:hypothetical protein
MRPMTQRTPEAPIAPGIDSFRAGISKAQTHTMKRHSWLAGNRNTLRLAILSLLVCAFGWQPHSALSQPTQPISVTPRDGQHDFDFNIGVWHTHIRRVLDPLSGSGNSVELNGTVTVRKIWDGRAQLEEIEADGPRATGRA